MFLDLVTISCKAGEGGRGAVSFHREKYVQYGGPDGGDGGDGGSVYFEADPSMNTLYAFRFTKKFKAKNGNGGAQKLMSGKDGEDIIIKVPLGTVIKDTESGNIIADIYEYDKKTLILKGGRGGRGNARFANSRRQSPEFSELGEKTEERQLTLELKLIADAGIIGKPNAGKSTLLSVISAAKPKIANYQFTTLTPNLGVVYVDESSFVALDIPGLIEGAAMGLGLGHSFLRHIERVRLLVHLLDVSNSDGVSFIENYNIIRNELSLYDIKLENLPEIVVLNKIDLVDEKALESAIDEFYKLYNIRPLTISAVTTNGIEKLKREVANKLKELPKAHAIEFEPFSFETKDKTEFFVARDEDSYVVYGGMIEELSRKVVLNNQESFAWFQRKLRELGVIDELKALGLKSGDSIAILDIEFDYEE